MRTPKFGISGSGAGISLLLMLYCFMAFPPCVEASPDVPEKFIYHVYWIGIRAGTATLDIENTDEGITITSRTQSAPFISVFYKVDDIARSTLNSNGYPNRYILKIREGRHRRDKATYFGIKTENAGQKIIYNNKLDNETAEFELEREAYDPLSAFYEIRNRTLTIGNSEYLDIFESKKLLNVEVRILRNEKVHVPAGEFDTIVIKPVMKSEGIFIKKGAIHIWLTNDEKKIPVMIKSRVKIGSFVAKLVDGAY